MDFSNDQAAVLKTTISRSTVSPLSNTDPALPPEPVTTTMPPPTIAARKYGSQLTGQFHNHSVPTHIKCNVCKNVKPSATCFSNRQQDLLVAHMRRTPDFVAARDAYAVCTSCTSQQVVELQCFYCDKTKGLDKFPLKQRKNPDTAECWSCQQERQNPNADSGDGSTTSNRADSDDSDTGNGCNSTSQSRGASLSTEMDELSLAGRNQYGYSTPTSGGTGVVSWNQTSRAGGTYASATSSGSVFGDTSRLNGVSLSSAMAPSSRPPISTTSSAASSSTIANGDRPLFDRNAYRDSGRRAPASEAGSTRSSNTTSGNGKFAKVKAVPRNTVYDVAEQEREERERLAAAVEDDEYEWAAKSDDDYE